MPDYQKMYHIMFNAATDAERLLAGDSRASMILRKAQQDCEELYIEAAQRSEVAHIPRS